MYKVYVAVAVGLVKALIRKEAILTLLIVACSLSVQADPMAPDKFIKMVSETEVAEETQDESGLTLTAILISDGQRFAIINDQWLSIGSILNQYRITHISEDHVHLNRLGKAHLLELPPPGFLAIKPVQ